MVTISAGDGLKSGIRVEDDDIFSPFLSGLVKTSETLVQLPNEGFEVTVTFANGMSLLIRGKDPVFGSYTLTGVTYRDAGGDLLVSMTGINKFISNVVPISLILSFIYNAADTVTGSRFADVLNMESGNDRISGLAGADSIDGGFDNDTMWGNQGHDRLVGEDGDDLMYGGIDNDRLQGDFGSDSLFGGTGADTLNGGYNRDVLYAGTDLLRDVFVFETRFESEVGWMHDTIYGMVHGTDVINLLGLDANQTAGGNQSFRFAGQNAAANSVWVVDTGAGLLVRADTNGDIRADFEISVANIATLTAADFIL